jgi:RNA polymerase sigma-70 factor, ECF subfamily
LRPERNYTTQQYAELFQQGDEKALAFFYKEFHPALALYANRWLKDRSVSEEIASEAFVKIWQKRWKLTGYHEILAYLYKTVQRDCQRAFKKEQKRVEVYKAGEIPATTADTPFDHLLHAEVHRLLHLALKELPPGRARVLTMHFLEGKTTGQIARELNLSASTIKTAKAKGLEDLRKKFRRPILLLLHALVKIFLFS